jgi:phosphoesterase RecJ-like protein
MPTIPPIELDDWEQADDLLNAAQRVIILTHVSPDGDAIGSMLGLGHALTLWGKTVTMAVDEGVPPHLAFLPGSEVVRTDLAGVEADLVIVVDCSDERRVGNMGKAARTLGLPWINLDHHATNVGFADANIMDSTFVSASEGVMRWLYRNNAPLPLDSAICLLCGLVTDTMCFRTASVTSDTLALANDLMRKGANLTHIVQHTIARMPTTALYLWGKVLPTASVQDHIALARISLAARQEAAYTESSDGGLVSWMLQADDAYIACVLKEVEGNAVEISLRAKPGFDVGKVAFAVGGGGHTLASGATMLGTFEEVEARLRPLLRAAVESGTPAYNR